jgi:hypothetical protein
VGTSAEADQLVPSNVAYAPELVIARHNDEDGHDTEIIPCGPLPATVDHL